jgi:hypothetical protein
MMRAAAAVAVGTLALAGSITGMTSPVAGAHATSTTGDKQLVFNGQVIGTAKFGTDGSAANFSADATTIPYWRSSFTWNGTTYPYTMVGANPNTNSSTTVTTWVIPLKFNFSNGDSLDGNVDTSWVLNSPIFTGNPWNSFTSSGGTTTSNLGTTQYGDAVQRVEFNKTGTNYHVLLNNAQTFAPVSIDVPSNQGYDLRYSSTGTPAFGLLSAQWFAQREGNLINQLHVPSNVVPIFLTDSVFLYTGNRGNPGGCCILGWHGASTSLKGSGKQQVQTYIYASFARNFFFCGDSDCNTIAPIADIHALSHEVAEWLNDPFVNNTVPDWSVPFEPQYGCSSDLEAGDPLVGFSPNTFIGFGNTTATFYHPQDIPLAPWFERQATAGSLSNTYTFPDNDVTLANQGATGFNTYSPGC